MEDTVQYRRQHVARIKERSVIHGTRTSSSRYTSIVGSPMRPAGSTASVSAGFLDIAWYRLPIEAPRADRSAGSSWKLCSMIHRHGRCWSFPGGRAKRIGFATLSISQRSKCGQAEWRTRLSRNFSRPMKRRASSSRSFTRIHARFACARRLLGIDSRAEEAVLRARIEMFFHGVRFRPYHRSERSV